MTRKAGGLAIIGAFCAVGAAGAQTATCQLTAVNNNVNRMTCNLGAAPAPPGGQFTITHVSGECESTAYGTFSVKQFQIVVIPAPPLPGKPVKYQLPINKSMINSGFVTGSFSFAAAQTSITVLGGSPMYALVDVVTPSPGEPLGRNVQECNVAYSG